MKIDRLDAHDRFEHFTRQEFNIGACCQDLINQRPFGDVAFYAFVHARTEDDGVTKRMIWQPRLTKPKAQENSMLFKLYPGSDAVKVLWMIPARELWKNFKRGQMTQNQLIAESIHNFQHNKKKLEAKEDDDLSDEEINKVYSSLAAHARMKKVHG